ncbi:MAG: oxidoreductase, partial [Blastocatellia bacterium]|nr:oxidoreductase [Blastocatellia bacterium]
MKAIVSLMIVCIAALVSSAQWIKQDVATTASFRGLSVVNEKVIWASGTGGTVIRTVDGGKKWDVIQVPDAAKLDFRDIEAFDANTAYILSIGNGESSRIYKTTDGGKSWKEQFRNKNEKAFYDAIACINSTRCFAMSDPIDNSFLLIRTNNGGAEWQELPYWSRTIDGEAAFAASGTCLIVYRDGRTHTLGIVSGG